MSVPREGRESLKVVAELIMSCMGLDKEHVVDGDEKYDVPNDKGLFVALFDEGPQYVSDTSRFNPETGQEEQAVSMQHPVRVEMMSFSDEVRKRKEELQLAVSSVKAQQLAARYQCQIAPQVERFVNATDAEPAGRLRRYVTRVMVISIHNKNTAVDYFDKFNGATQDQTAKSPEVKTS